MWKASCALGPLADRVSGASDDFPPGKARTCGDDGMIHMAELSQWCMYATGSGEVTSSVISAARTRLDSPGCCSSSSDLLCNLEKDSCCRDEQVENACVLHVALHTRAAYERSHGALPAHSLLVARHSAVPCSIVSLVLFTKHWFYLSSLSPPSLRCILRTSCGLGSLQRVEQGVMCPRRQWRCSGRSSVDGTLHEGESSQV